MMMLAVMAVMMRMRMLVAITASVRVRRNRMGDQMKKSIPQKAS